ncbi:MULTISPECIES: glycosyltransferase family 2 protein [Glaesserella]|uniref:Glycosyl transferase n=1 Tax=Glaesserella australis TaxID=2094024 RepID=A0A328C079_9PAST|nr:MULTISPECIES: glycosyltransferase family 2 protein [Glaesserella]AUI66518.1 glycosyl transferase [Glaesserella sp. 15-184]RAL18692.1 glycosyl transferase [Glaesserella australis]
MQAEFKPVVMIPHYNHSNTIKNVVKQILSHQLPVLIVDDGSTAEHHTILHQLAEKERVSVVFCHENGGKGAAVKVGFKQAFEQGYSHMVQVDADGQHQLSDVLKMVELAKQNPEAMICGKPIYSDDAPKARLYGRKITNFWIAINTLSLDIPDGMCGFRLYPLISTLPIIQQDHIGDRMDFDVEILVRCHWRKIPMIWIDTPVKYEQGGISHFRGWADNWLISKMHTRLFFGMLGRIFTGKSV